MIAYSLDRLTRRVKQVGELIELAQLTKTQIVTTKNDLDLSSSQGVAFATMAAVFAELEVNLKSERHQAANAQRYAAGKHFGRSIPMGYRRGEDGSLIHDQETSEHLRKAWKRVLEGASIRDVLLSWEGVIPTRRGGPWTNASVYRILTNSIYAGILTHKGEVVKLEQVNWEPYLTVEEHEAVLARLSRKTDPGRKRAPRRTYLLSGIILCSCGRHMTGGVRGDGELIYVCSGRDHGLCSRTILVTVADTGAIRHAVGTIHTLPPDAFLTPDKVARQTAISKELIAILKKRADLRKDEEIDEEDLEILMRRYSKKERGLRAELDGLVTESTLAGAVSKVLSWRPEEGMEAGARSRQNVRERFEELDFTTKRLILDGLGVYQHKPVRRGKPSELVIYAKDPLTGEVSQHTIDEDPDAMD